MARSKAVRDEVDAKGSIAVGGGNIDASLMTKPKVRVMPEWFPSELPEDENELVQLAKQIKGETGVVPRGAQLFAKAVHQLTHHKPLANAAQQRLADTWAYMHGQTSPGTIKGARKRSVKSRATKFYEALSEPALMRHCAMHELDYDSLKAEGRVVATLIEAAAGLV